MNETRPTAEERLARIKPVTLSEEKRDRLWNRIRVGMHSRPTPIESPYSIISLFIYKKYVMIPALIALLLVAGGGTAVAASDNARPGDVLFPVDRAVENVRIAFAGDDSKDELRLRFANERANEVESIIDEEGARTRLAMETRTKAKSSDDAVSAESTMQAKFASDDASTSGDDSGDDSNDDSSNGRDDSEDDNGGERIAAGLSVAIDYLSDVSAELEAKGNTDGQKAIDAVIARLNTKIGEIPDDLRARLRLGDDGEVRIRVKTASEDENSDSEGKFEFRGEGVKTNVEFKNGEIKIESKTDDDSSRGDSKNPSLEVEADVFTDKAVVKVERGGVKELFITSAATRAEIVAAVAAKFNMSEASVDAVLDFQIENRASRPDDMLLSGSNNAAKDIGDGLDDDVSNLLDDDSDDDGILHDLFDDKGGDDGSDDDSGGGSDDNGGDDDDDRGDNSGHGGGDEDDD